MFRFVKPILKLTKLNSKELKTIKNLRNIKWKSSLANLNYLMVKN